MSSSYRGVDIGTVFTDVLVTKTKIQFITNKQEAYALAGGFYGDVKIKKIKGNTQDLIGAPLTCLDEETTIVTPMFSRRSTFLITYIFATDKGKVEIHLTAETQASRSLRLYEDYPPRFDKMHKMPNEEYYLFSTRLNRYLIRFKENKIDVLVNYAKFDRNPEAIELFKRLIKKERFRNHFKANSEPLLADDFFLYSNKLSLENRLKQRLPEWIQTLIGLN